MNSDANLRAAAACPEPLRRLLDARVALTAAEDRLAARSRGVSLQPTGARSTMHKARRRRKAAVLALLDTLLEATP